MIACPTPKMPNMILENELLTDLTSAQRQAVTHIDGPMLVLAGPGSGKTRVITHRVAYLITQGIDPSRILAITFTNKAANEMRQRLRALHVPSSATICTFHSLAARLLREFCDRAAIPANFTIYDDADQTVAVRDALKAADLDSQNYPPAKMLAAISRHKNNLETPEQIARDQDFFSKIVARIYAAYQKQLDANNALDFDDLLMKLSFLLRDDPPLRDQLNERFRYVLVDEYQDTNHSQYQIARGLSLNHQNLFVTGDPDQSIYGWRGADIGNILAFEQDYPETHIVRLEENFRSTPQVLQLADELIRANRRRKHKKLFTARPNGAAPALIEYDDEHHEALGMTQWIAALREQGRQYRDIAIFYRVNSMSRVLEKALRQQRIPYQIVRGLEFFQRREVKDILAYLRILANPADRVSLKRIINRPTRGIGATTIKRIFDHGDATGKNIWQILENLEDVPTLGAAAKKKVKAFVDLIVSLQGLLQNPIAEIVNQAYYTSGLADALDADPNREEKKANAEELISSASEYDAEAETPSLEDYLQQIALFSDADAYDNQAGAVSLMTLHAAKGLEFPCVLIIGVEDGLIPHSRSMNTADDVEEERRLLFVGMTRTKKELCLSYARNRTLQGLSRATIRSEFLRPLQHLQVHRAERQDRDDQTENDLSDDDFGPDLYDDNTGPASAFSRGQLVRHPTLGLGRIQQVLPSRKEPRVVVQFTTAGRKTLYLQYAKLEKIHFPDT